MMTHQLKYLFVLFGLFQKTSKDNAIALNFKVDQIQAESKMKAKWDEYKNKSKSIYLYGIFCYLLNFTPH